MKYIKLLAFAFIVLVFLISYVSAITDNEKEISYVFKRNTLSDLKIPCVDANQSVCKPTTACQLTISSPTNASFGFNNRTMTYQYNYFNYTLSESDVSKNGIYQGIVNCKGVDSGIAQFFYEVTTTGTTQTTSQGINSLVFFVSIMFLTIVFGIAGFKLLQSDVLWVLGIFSLFFALLFVVYDIYLGMDYYMNNMGLTEPGGIPQTILMFVLIAIVGCGIIAVLLMVAKWNKLVKWVKKAIRENEDSEEEDSDE